MSRTYVEFLADFCSEIDSLCFSASSVYTVYTVMPRLRDDAAIALLICINQINIYELYCFIFPIRPDLLARPPR